VLKTVNEGCLTLVCADLNAMPLFSTDDMGQRFGYEPEIAKVIAQQLGLKLKWRYSRWSDFELALFDNKADAIWCGCAITAARQDHFCSLGPMQRLMSLC